MDDIDSSYAPMIEQIAKIYAGNEAVQAQLRSLKVTREEWDSDRRGGHFWFEVSASAALSDDFLVSAYGDDADGAKIDIALHPVNGTLNWGEWYRVPLPPDDLEQPIKWWPASSVSPK